jgi:hypothetical protein
MAGAAVLKKLAKAFSCEGISTDGKVLRCELCNCSIKVDSKHHNQPVHCHLKTEKHKTAVAKSNARQPTLSHVMQTMEGNVKFEEELALAFIQSGIPLIKLNAVPLKRFLEKNIKRKIPDESTIRKNYTKPVYSKTLEKVRSIIADHPVLFILDETMDAKKRNVLNVLVAPLNGEPVKPMLLKCTQMEKTNSETTMRGFTSACAFLWNGELFYDRVWLVVTDQASYMLKAFKQLKAMFPNLAHVTCLAHALHRVCEAVRDENQHVDKFIAAMRKVMLKAPARIDIYRDVFGSDAALPPDPVVTRWGSWINAAVFYCENFQKVQIFIDTLPLSDDAAAVVQARTLVEDERLKDELFCVATFKFLTTGIERLEQQGLTKEAQWSIYREVEQFLDGSAQHRFSSNLSRNPDVKSFATEADPEKRLKTRFAPLVSVDVERSFSLYKHILSDRRMKFSMQNIEMFNVIAYNKFLYLEEPTTVDIDSDDDMDM